MNNGLKRWASLVLGLITILCCGCAEKNGAPAYKLWYDEPAKEWIEALPVGNGRLGAMVFGYPDRERIQLNEESLWAGQPINNNNPLALENLPRIRQMLFEGKNRQAFTLAQKTLLGTPPEIRSYQTLGDLYLIRKENSSIFHNYRRELDLSTGIALVRYDTNGMSVSRQIFSSAPHNLLAVHLKTEGGEGWSGSIVLTREHDARVHVVSDNRLLMQGQIIDDPDPEKGPGGAHMRFAALLDVQITDGILSSAEDVLILENVSEALILLTAATDYDLDRLDFDRSVDPVQQCQDILDAAKGSSFEELVSRHLKDHQSLFNRVKFDLGPDTLDYLPTDERLERVKKGADDPGLVTTYFQYGRYLLMGSSRAPGVLPANLQGIWNHHFEAPWNSDYHTNINLQMNYWPAQVTNLAETVPPLIEFFDRLRMPGRITARDMYGAEGWTMHHVTDPFGRTGLMDGIQWGTSPLAGAWMCLSLWRQYEFMPDETLLREKIYPILKGAAEFTLDFLVEGPEGYLVTAPSMSPENAFYLPGTRETTQLTYAATIDIEIIHELFNACIIAARALEQDSDFAQTLQQTLDRLPPLQIGADGTLQEWIKDYEEAEPGHRHISHLFGLYPGTLINPHTPELFEAARRTIEKRLAHGGGHTGWSRAWIISFYARLLDAEQAHHHLHQLLAKSTLPNLFDTHPPFQIDGNFGGTAGIAEMLLQSHSNEIRLLPALPKAWPQGSITGLRARGAVEVDIKWENGVLTEARLRPEKNLTLAIVYKDKRIEMDAEINSEIVLHKDIFSQYKR